MVMDPEQLASVQAVTKDIKAKLTADYTTNTITLELYTHKDEALGFMRILLEQFTTQVATQLGSFFNIKGELVEVGKAVKPGS